MEKTTGVDLYNKVLSLSMQNPSMKVNREEFLNNVFSDFCTEQELEQIIKENPRTVLDLELIDAVADNVISTSRYKVSIISTLTGIPGNPIAATGTRHRRFSTILWVLYKSLSKVSLSIWLPRFSKRWRIKPKQSKYNNSNARSNVWGKCSFKSFSRYDKKK